MRREYDWINGQELKPHTQKKLAVIRSYFHNYLRVIVTPIVRKLKIAIVDGFAGGGKYENNYSGSPLVFLEELDSFYYEYKIRCEKEKIPSVSIECLFMVNELNQETLEILKKNIKYWDETKKSTSQEFNIIIEYSNKKFIEFYYESKDKLKKHKYNTVIYNIDPYGYTDLKIDIIKDIMTTFQKPEVFFTFMIGAVLQYLNPKSIQKENNAFSQYFGIPLKDILNNGDMRSKPEWLGHIQRILFDHTNSLASFVSPFAINQTNNQGYKYWLMHFSKSSRGREVYNNVLHEQARSQVHYGRFGLDMLGYSPSDNTADLFDFGRLARGKSIEQLYDDIPKLVESNNHSLRTETFRNIAYNSSPAHSDDINETLILHPDLEVITPKGHHRRSANQIDNNDTIRLKPQNSFVFMRQNNKK